MQHPTTLWLQIAFLLVGLILISAVGLVGAIAVEVMSPQAPEVVLGTILCPTESRLDLDYIISGTGAAREINAVCIDPSGATVASPPGWQANLWYALFMVPLLPLGIPLAGWLRRYNLEY
jgi:hypothetical protein